MQAFPRHQCLIYDGAPTKHLSFVAETMVARLSAHYRCLYLNSPAMVTAMRTHLLAAGFDLTEATGRGALKLTSDQSHLIAGQFDADRMLQLLYQALHEALADGYKGLWASGDMTWELGGERNFDKLLDYERKLDDFLERNPTLSGVCLYHRDTLPAHAIDTALATHPAILLGDSRWQPNPKYRRQAVE